jgi:hypothetical protein
MKRPTADAPKRPGQAHLRQVLRSLRQAAVGKSAAEFRSEMLAQSQPTAPAPPPAPSHDLAAISRRLDALEAEFARMRESDARLIRAILMAAALLVIELLTR